MGAEGTAAPEKSADKKTVTLTIRKMRFKHKLILIIFSLVMMVLMRTGFVFFVIGMLPCIVAYYMDVTKHRYTFHSVFAANLSGMMPYITKIVANGPSSTMLQEIMGNSMSWIVIYGSAMTGWALVKFCPLVAQMLVHSSNQASLARYDSLQKKLEGEWGPEVKQFSGESAIADE